MVITMKTKAEATEFCNPLFGSSQRSIGRIDPNCPIPKKMQKPRNAPSKMAFSPLKGGFRLGLNSQNNIL